MSELHFAVGRFFKAIEKAKFAFMLIVLCVALVAMGNLQIDLPDHIPISGVLLVALFGAGVLAQESRIDYRSEIKAGLAKLFPSRVTVGVGNYCRSVRLRFMAAIRRLQLRARLSATKFGPRNANLLNRLSLTNPSLSASAAG